jgi:hypothetical protein
MTYEEPLRYGPEEDWGSSEEPGEDISPPEEGDSVDRESRRLPPSDPSDHPSAGSPGRQPEDWGASAPVQPPYPRGLG